MDKKIHPIILSIGNNDHEHMLSISLSLSQLNIYHKQINIIAIDHIHDFIHDITHNMKRFVNKTIIISNLKNIVSLNDAIPEHNNSFGKIKICFIGDHKEYQKLDNNLKKKINHWEDVQDFVDDMMLDDVTFYTNREVSRINNLKYQSINVSIVTTKKTQNAIAIKSSIENINPIKHDYLIDHISMTYMNEYFQYGDINSGINSGTNINSGINSGIDINSGLDDDLCHSNEDDVDDEDTSKHNNISVNKFVKSMENININFKLDRKAIEYWYLLYLYQQYFNYNSKVDIIIVFQDTDKVTKIDVSEYINKLIKGKKTSEQIYICDDIFAIGTKRIMLYYMLLYEYYGSYKPWTNVRKFLTNGIWDHKHYYKLSKEMYLTPIIQLSEHIMHFSDQIILEINEIDINTIDRKSIYIYGIPPHSFISTLQNLKYHVVHDNIHNHHSMKCGDNNIICSIYWNLDFELDLVEHTKGRSIYYASHLTKETYSQYSDFFKKMDDIYVSNCDDIDDDKINKVKYYDILNLHLNLTHHNKIDEDLCKCSTDVLFHIVSESSLKFANTLNDIANDYDLTIEHVDEKENDDDHDSENYRDYVIKKIKYSKLIITDDVNICLIAMCHRRPFINLSSEDCTFLIPNETYISLDQNRYAKQFKLLLNDIVNERLFEKYKIMTNRALIVSESMQWSNFALKILHELNQLPIS